MPTKRKLVTKRKTRNEMEHYNNKNGDEHQDVHQAVGPNVLRNCNK